MPLVDAAGGGAGANWSASTSRRCCGAKVQRGLSARRDAIAGAAHDRRAREEIETFRASTGRSRPSARTRPVRSPRSLEAGRQEGRAVHHHQCRRGRGTRRAHRHDRGQFAARHRTWPAGTQAPPGAAFTTSALQQEAARKPASPRLKTHGGRAEVVRGRGAGRRRRNRPDQLHAVPTRSTCRRKRWARLRDVIARDFGTASRRTSRISTTRPSRRTRRKLAARRARPRHCARRQHRYLSDDERKLYDLVWKRAIRQPDDPATLQHRDLSTSPPAASTASAPAAPPWSSPASSPCTGRQGREVRRRRRRPQAAGDEARRQGAAGAHPRRPALHPAAAALHRSGAGEGAGGIRHRPASTYASIIQTLLFRKYVEMESRSFRPTDVGRAVSKFLSAHFTRYVDYDFTAKLEDELDAVSRGEEDWVPLMEKFWNPFRELVEEKSESVDRSEATGARELGTDPKSGKPVSVRLGLIRPVPADQQGHRREAGIRLAAPSQSVIHTITLGGDPADSSTRWANRKNGEGVCRRHRRFGAFAKRGSPRLAQGKEGDDPHAIDLARGVPDRGKRKKSRATASSKEWDSQRRAGVERPFGPYLSTTASSTARSRGSADQPR